MSHTQAETDTSLEDLQVLERPRHAQPPSVGTAIRRHPVIVLFMVLLCLAAGAAAGLKRHPTYTASAKLQIAGINLSAPGALSGLLTAEETLAASYSRAASSQTVVTQVAGQMHMSPTQVLAGVSATPVPQSGNFTVTGTSKNSSTAIALANDTANALVSYVTALNRSSSNARKLFRQIKKISSQLVTAQAQALVAGAAVAQAKGHPSAAQVNALVKSRTAVETLNTNLEALRQTYVTALAAQASTSTAQLVAPALQATSDRITKLEIFLFAGLGAGLILGTALAMLRARRKYARSFA